MEGKRDGGGTRLVREGVDRTAGREGGKGRPEHRAEKSLYTTMCTLRKAEEPAAIGVK
jgi:hypothetical protein